MKSGRGNFPQLFLLIGIFLFPASVPAADSGYAPGYCNSSGVDWKGTGKTISVSPGQSIQSAVDSSSPGDTIELANGTYNQVTVDLNKAVRLKSATPFGAVLMGATSTPTKANDSSSSPTQRAVNISSSGAWVEGLEMRYYGVAIAIDGVGNVVIQKNRIVSVFEDGVQIWDTKNVEVRCNEFYDPYLANDPLGSLTSGPGGFDAQSDYGVSIYGSIDAKIHHNYFIGIFNQTLSFKEGNRNAYAGYNTFEGCQYTCLFYGQNEPHNGPFEFAGLPVGPDKGTMTAEYNIFREVTGTRGGSTVTYFARTPIRIWHIDGDMSVNRNVVESAQEGIRIENPAAGNISIENNVIGGKVKDTSGNLVTVNTSGGININSGVPATISINHDTLAFTKTAIQNATGVKTTVKNSEFFQNTSWGSSATEDYNNFFQSDGTHAGAHDTAVDPLFAGTPDFSLRRAKVSLDPDFTFANSFQLTAASSGKSNGEGGTYRGAFPLTAGSSPTPTGSTSCQNTYPSNSTPPSGYGTSWNVLSTSKELLLQAKSCSGGNANITVGSPATDVYTYSQGYYWSGTRWEQYVLTGTFAAGSTVWIIGSGTSTIPHSQATTYFIGYTCQRSGTQWKCGCRDTACTTRAWQLQGIQ